MNQLGPVLTPVQLFKLRWTSKVAISGMEWLADMLILTWFLIAIGRVMGGIDRAFRLLAVSAYSIPMAMFGMSTVIVPIAVCTGSMPIAGKLPAEPQTILLTMMTAVVYAVIITMAAFWVVYDCEAMRKFHQDNPRLLRAYVAFLPPAFMTGMAIAMFSTCAEQQHATNDNFEAIGFLFMVAATYVVSVAVSKALLLPYASKHWIDRPDRLNRHDRKRSLRLQKLKLQVSCYPQLVLLPPFEDKEAKELKEACPGIPLSQTFIPGQPAQMQLDYDQIGIWQTICQDYVGPKKKSSIRRLFIFATCGAIFTYFSVSAIFAATSNESIWYFTRVLLIELPQLILEHLKH